MKITPEMFGLTKEEVAEFEKQDERIAKLQVKAFIVTLKYPKFATYVVGHLMKKFDITREQAVELWTATREA